jgi:hypothetical protein
VRLLVPRAILFTSELPGFDARLLHRLPLLWSTICHNDDGLSFVDELRATEMGHVVEHVVLALLILNGIYAKGTTEWNWLEEPEGSFAITLDGEGLDHSVVEMALANAIEIIEATLRPHVCMMAQPQDNMAFAPFPVR